MGEGAMRTHLARVLGRLGRRRPAPTFEVWEAPGNGRLLFMVANRLTRRDALEAADRLGRAWPHPRTVVLDGNGAALDRAGGAAGWPRRLAPPPAS
jgi:hypothetical protein